jgi:hypothetical protein
VIRPFFRNENPRLGHRIQEVFKKETNSLAVTTGNNCKYHIVFALKYRRQIEKSKKILEKYFALFVKEKV